MQRNVVTQRLLTHFAIEIDKEEAKFAGEVYDETECSNHYDEQGGTGQFLPQGYLFRFPEVYSQFLFNRVISPSRFFTASWEKLMWLK